jgi:hypothetical protein
LEKLLRRVEIRRYEDGSPCLRNLNNSDSIERPANSMPRLAYSMRWTK